MTATATACCLLVGDVDLTGCSTRIRFGERACVGAVDGGEVVEFVVEEGASQGFVDAGGVEGGHCVVVILG